MMDYALPRDKYFRRVTSRTCCNGMYLVPRLHVPLGPNTRKLAVVTVPLGDIHPSTPLSPLLYRCVKRPEASRRHFFSAHIRVGRNRTPWHEITSRRRAQAGQAKKRRISCFVGRTRRTASGLAWIECGNYVSHDSTFLRIAQSPSTYYLR